MVWTVLVATPQPGRAEPGAAASRPLCEAAAASPPSAGTATPTATPRLGNDGTLLLDSAIFRGTLDLSDLATSHRLSTLADHALPGIADPGEALDLLGIERRFLTKVGGVDAVIPRIVIRNAVVTGNVRMAAEVREDGPPWWLAALLGRERASALIAGWGGTGRSVWVPVLIGRLEIRDSVICGGIQVEGTGALGGISVLQSTVAAGIAIRDSKIAENLVISDVTTSAAIAVTGSKVRGGTNLLCLHGAAPAEAPSVDFSGSSLLGDLTMGGSRCGGPSGSDTMAVRRIDMYGTKLAGHRIRFDSIRIREQSDFATARFETRPQFRNVAFDNGAGFNNAEFSDGVEFSANPEFSADTALELHSLDFTRATIRGHALSIVSHKASGGVDLPFARMPGGVEVTGVATAHLSLANATDVGTVVIEASDIGRIDLSAGRFAGEVLLRKNTFGGAHWPADPAGYAVGLSSARVAAALDLRDSKILGPLYLDRLSVAPELFRFHWEDLRGRLRSRQVGGSPPQRGELEAYKLLERSLADRGLLTDANEARYRVEQIGDRSDLRPDPTAYVAEPGLGLRLVNLAQTCADGYLRDCYWGYGLLPGRAALWLGVLILLVAVCCLCVPGIRGHPGMHLGYRLRTLPLHNLATRQPVAPPAFWKRCILAASLGLEITTGVAVADVRIPATTAGRAALWTARGAGLLALALFLFSIAEYSPFAKTVLGYVLP